MFFFHLRLLEVTKLESGAVFRRDSTGCHAGRQGDVARLGRWKLRMDWWKTMFRIPTQFVWGSRLICGET